jgi:hypothetical protein
MTSSFETTLLGFVYELKHARAITRFFDIPKKMPRLY